MLGQKKDQNARRHGIMAKDRAVNHFFGSHSYIDILGLDSLPKKFLIINFLNLLSVMFFLDSKSPVASFPTTYLRSGLVEEIAFNITFATSSAAIERLSSIDFLLISLTSTNLA